MFAPTSFVFQDEFQRFREVAVPGHFLSTTGKPLPRRRLVVGAFMISLASQLAPAAFCLSAFCDPSRANGKNSFTQLFELADKLCATRNQDQAGDAYEACQSAQYLAITRLTQGMFLLRERDSFGVAYKHCLMQSSEISSGLPDFDAALNCIVDKAPNTKKLFFPDEAG